MDGIFISYRHTDAAGDAGRLHERLQECCEPEIFQDITIPAGADFRVVLSAKLDACKVVLVLIGPRWLDIRDPTSGQRRLDLVDDWVRFEIATALRTDKLVVPVLLADGRLPRAEDMPHDIRDLANRQAVIIRHDRWTDDVNNLLAQIPGCQEFRSAGVSLTTREMFTLVGLPVSLLSAFHVVTVFWPDDLPAPPPPETSRLAISFMVAALQAYRLRSRPWGRVGTAAMVAVGVGLLTSTVVPLIGGDDIVPRSLAPVRKFMMLVAEVFIGYLVGALLADSWFRHSKQKAP
jgi:hypothetical protein